MYFAYLLFDSLESMNRGDATMVTESIFGSTVEKRVSLPRLGRWLASKVVAMSGNGLYNEYDGGAIHVDISIGRIIAILGGRAKRKLCFDVRNASSGRIIAVGMVSTKVLSELERDLRTILKVFNNSIRELRRIDSEKARENPRHIVVRYDFDSEGCVYALRKSRGSRVCIDIGKDYEGYSVRQCFKIFEGKRVIGIFIEFIDTLYAIYKLDIDRNTLVAAAVEAAKMAIDTAIQHNKSSLATIYRDKAFVELMKAIATVIDLGIEPDTVATLATLTRG